MNIREKRTSPVELAGLGQVSVKHLTTKDFHQFQVLSQTDKEAGLKFLVQTSLEIGDAEYDDIPMSLLKPLVDGIMSANGLSKEQEEEAIKN